MIGRSIILATLLCIAIPALSQVQEMHPLLPYIFFDSANAVIPDRYTLFASPEEAKAFSETELLPNTLDVYHHLLNIIGSRMRRYPDTHIEIVGCNSMQPEIGEVIEVSKKRGEIIRIYLSEIWGIDTSRIRLLPARDFPQYRSNPRDSLGVVENRRAEILTDDWRIIQTVITRDTKPHPELADSTLDIYNLILFKFDSPEMSAHDERIVQKNIIAELRKDATIKVTAYDERIAWDDRCLKLANSRATTVVKAIKQAVKQGFLASLVGDISSTRLHSNALPEERFYNRCVQVRVTTP